jgi:hypothetical protein
MRIAVDEYLKCNGKESIARQHGGCLVEGDMRRRSSSAEVVIVHAWEIVMDQGICVQHFHGSANTQSARRIDVKQRRRAQNQKRAQPFAGGENGISHRLVDALVQTMRRRQNTLQQRVDVARRIRHRLP